MSMEDKFFEELQIGDKRTFTKTITETDIVLFAGVSGDFSPLHINVEYAKTGVFGERVAHGLFTSSLLSAAVCQFPGDIVYLSLNTKFLQPVKIGDTIEAVSTIKAKGEKWELTMEHNCYNQRGECVVEGEAKIKAFPHRRR